MSLTYPESITVESRDPPCFRSDWLRRRGGSWSSRVLRIAPLAGLISACDRFVPRSLELKPVVFSNVRHALTGGIVELHTTGLLDILFNLCYNEIIKGKHPLKYQHTKG